MRTPRNNLPMNGSLPKATILKTYLRTKHAAIFVWKISTLSLLRLYLLAPLCGDLIGRLFKYQNLCPMNGGNLSFSLLSFSAEWKMVQ